jgi:methyl-accepting chemotaxis protein
MKVRSSMSLRTSILSASFASILLVIVTLLISGKTIQNQSEQRFQSATIDGKALLWNEILNNQMSAMKAGMSGIARDSTIRKALQKKDGPGIKENAEPAYKRLSTSGVLTKLQLTDLEGNILFSTNNLSGTTKKTLVLQALKQGKVLSGIERDDDGELNAVVVFPLYTRGKAIGTGVYLRNLNGAVSALKASQDSDIYIVNSQGKPEYATDADLYSRVALEIPPLGEKRFSVENAGEQTFATTITPVNDPSGTPLAHLVSISDYTESYSRESHLTLISMLVTITIVVLVLGGFTWFTKRAFQPLQSAVSTLNQIAEGDLSMEIDSSRKDEIGQLMGAMSSMAGHLREVISEFKATSQHLADSSREMHMISDETRHSVQQQTSETELVATAMNEMAATVQEVARSASEAASAAQTADADAQSGQALVQKSSHSINTLASNVQNTAGAIAKLENESREIGSVLDVIKGIAEQTNLLALNAAIEAARAGEQGRGFAVVADEVRTLAARTQQSTQDIQEMIERLQGGAHTAVETMQASLENVSVNVDQASQTLAALETITAAVGRINEMNMQIASAAEEQGVVAEEINRNVVNISQAAEASADGANRTSSASDTLLDKAEQLNRIISRFRL